MEIPKRMRKCLKEIVSRSDAAFARRSLKTRPFARENCQCCEASLRMIYWPRAADVPRCAKIFSGAGHFQRDVSQQSRRGDLIIVPAAFRIRSKDECLMSSDLYGRVRPKMETARLPGSRRHANRRLAPSPLATL